MVACCLHTKQQSEPGASIKNKWEVVIEEHQEWQFHLLHVIAYTVSMSVLGLMSLGRYQAYDRLMMGVQSGQI